MDEQILGPVHKEATLPPLHGNLDQGNASTLLLLHCFVIPILLSMFVLSRISSIVSELILQGGFAYLES